MDLPQEIATVRAELGRSDTKATALLGLAGTAASVVAGTAAFSVARLPGGALIALWTMAALLVGSVLVLLGAIRPSLPRPGAGHGWVAYAYSTPEALAATSTVQHIQDRRAELVLLSRIARTKYVLLRWAVDLLRTAVAAGVLAVILAIAGKGF
ncbi:Pycsar system effector family protein [Streptosporangium sp. NPDC000239]|uniref:Pycsar system effector family protein n=1 Tax=Streptosporangium sp. NPDC000239 TaxID=3154248 RepID=UPI003331F8A0